MAKPEAIERQHVIEHVDQAPERKGKGNLQGDFEVERAKHQYLDKHVDAVQANARLSQGKQVGSLAEHQRNRLKRRRAEIASRAQHHANAQNQNARRINRYAQRHRTRLRRPACTCCSAFASHNPLFSHWPMRCGPKRQRIDFPKCSSKGRANAPAQRRLVRAFAAHRVS